MSKPTQQEVDAAMVAQAPIVKIEPGSLAESSSFLQQAISSGISPEAIEKMHAIHREMAKDDAKRQFNAAMVAFQRDCPAMPRSGQHGGFKRTNAKGARVPGRYSTLEDIDKAISPVLRQCGLSYDWERTNTREAGGMVWFKCYLRIRHIAGHSECKEGPEIPMEQATTNAADRAASAQSRAHRMALVYGLGLCSMSEDDLDRPPPAEPVSEENARELRELLDALEHVTSKTKREAWERRMLAAFQIESIGQLPADKFDEVASKIQAGVEAAQP